MSFSIACIFILSVFIKLHLNLLQHLRETYCFTNSFTVYIYYSVHSLNTANCYSNRRLRIVRLNSKVTPSRTLWNVLKFRIDVSNCDWRFSRFRNSDFFVSHECLNYIFNFLDIFQVQCKRWFGATISTISTAISTTCSTLPRAIFFGLTCVLTSSPPWFFFIYYWSPGSFLI